MKTAFEEFVSDASRRRLYEREALVLQATELISKLMDTGGVHKSELAERIESSRANISQLLSGSRNMTLRTFSDLCYALGHRIELKAVSIAKTTRQRRPRRNP